MFRDRDPKVYPTYLLYGEKSRPRKLIINEGLSFDIDSVGREVKKGNYSLKELHLDAEPEIRAWTLTIEAGKTTPIQKVLSGTFFDVVIEGNGMFYTDHLSGYKDARRRTYEGAHSTSKGDYLFWEVLGHKDLVVARVCIMKSGESSRVKDIYDYTNVSPRFKTRFLKLQK